MSDGKYVLGEVEHAKDFFLAQPCQNRSLRPHEARQRGPGGSFQKEAAPRFELGVKDLQSSALPLGHAAALGANSLQRIVSAMACPPRR